MAAGLLVNMTQKSGRRWDRFPRVISIGKSSGRDWPTTAEAWCAILVFWMASKNAEQLI
jgi:hypothetical protein